MATIPAPPSAATLSALDVRKRYGATVALDGVSVEVAAGECLALVGESGSGKSTLLRMFNRMVEPDAGQVLVDGEDAAELDPVRLRRRIGYVPQDGGLLPHWRVLRNAALVPWLEGDAEAEDAARHALRLVGLEPERFGRRWPAELSGGQRQRVAIARALAARPRLLLLDEAFGALDAITRGDVQEVFLRLRAENPVTTVLVTHDLGEAAALGDRIAVLRAGRVEQSAPTAEVLHRPATDYVARLVSRSRARGI
jgi:osmoprotectant transport system ATP-binding protein